MGLFLHKILNFSRSSGGSRICYVTRKNILKLSNADDNLEDGSLEFWTGKNGLVEADTTGLEAWIT